MSTNRELVTQRAWRFEGKVVVVTGSARGIGRNIAHAFGSEGVLVAVCDIDDQQGRSTTDELRQQGISAEFLQVDLSQRGIPQAMVRQIAQQWGGLDILVNNARSRQRNSLLEEDEESWEREMVVTLRAAFFASQEAIHRNVSRILRQLFCEFREPSLYRCSSPFWAD